MNIQEVHRYPFLRILIPLILGTCCSDGLFFAFHYPVPDLRIFLPLFPLLLAITGCFRNLREKLFGYVLSAGFFLTGAVLTYCQLQDTCRPDDTSRHTYLARVLKQPQPKTKSICCPADFFPEDPDASPFRALLYLKPDSNSCRLQTGTWLMVNTRITFPKKNGIPAEFDYPKYLHRKGFAGTGYAASDNWKIYKEPDSGVSLIALAENCREKVLAYYRSLGFSGDSYAVLAALTTGYKEELSPEIESVYARSGASHLLAVSGLHVGFIYALAIALLGLSGAAGRNPWIRTPFILLVLGAFAFFTGLSPSVVRASLMGALFTLSQAISRGQRPGNSLLIAAFCMLVTRPLLLFDVSFQLSFCAVAGILLFTGKLTALLHPQNCLARYLWNLICVSLAAQIGTLSLVCLYFRQFPILGLLTNLVAIPLVSLLIYAAVAMLTLSWIPLLMPPTVWITGTLTRMLNQFLAFVEQIPGAVIEQINFYPSDCIGYLTVCCVAVLFLHRKTLRNYLATAGTAFVFLLLHIVQATADRPACSMSVYNIAGIQAVQCTESDGQTWMVYLNGQADSVRVEKQLAGHWCRQGLAPVTHCSHPVKLDGLHTDRQWVVFHDTSLLLLNRPTTRNTPDIAVDYLYLSKGFRGNLADLQSRIRFKGIIADGTLPEAVTHPIEKACREQDIPFTDLRTKGYWQIVVE